MGGGVNAREIIWAGERRYFLPVSYRDRGASQPSPYVDYTSIKSESDAEYASINADVDDTATVGGAVNVGVDLQTLSAITGKAFDAAVKGLGKTADVVGDGVENAANAIADAIPDPRPQINAALIIGGVAAFALLVIALRRQS